MKFKIKKFRRAELTEAMEAEEAEKGLVSRFQFHYNPFFSKKKKIQQKMITDSDSRDVINKGRVQKKNV